MAEEKARDHFHRQQLDAKLQNLFIHCKYIEAINDHFLKMKYVQRGFRTSISRKISEVY